MIWPARVWQQAEDTGQWVSRPVTDQDDARRQAVEAMLREMERQVCPDCTDAAGAR